MGIKAGSGRGGVDRSGSKAEVPGGVGSSRKRNRPQIGPPPQKKPLKPTENTFPEDKGFRLGQYEVLQEKHDYLLCTGYNPNAKNPASEVTPSAFRTGVLLKIAKPPALQRTYWDGATVTIDGIDYTYVYSDSEIGLRTAYWTDDDGIDQEEEQRIYPSYTMPTVDNQIIVAVEIKKNAAVEGMVIEDEDGVRLRWIDLNVGGRHWKSATAATTIIRFTITSAPDSSSAQAEATAVSCGLGDGNVTLVTVYDAIGCFLNEDPLSDLVGRKGYAVRMKSGTSCRYEIISLCCPPA